MIVIIGIVGLFLAAFAGYRYLTDQYRAEKAEDTQAEDAAERTEDAGETDAAERTEDAGETGGVEQAESTVKEDTSEQAQDFNVVDMEGKAVLLSEHFGKPIMINFWATWCGPCRSELQFFDELYQKYGDEVDFMMVNLTDGTRDTEKGVKSFIEENGYTFPIYLDKAYDAATAYGIYSIPMTVMIDSDGKISDTHIGSMDKETIEGYLLNMIE